MLHEVGNVSSVPDFIQSVKRSDRRLMGFGYRVYKTYDPRAALLRKLAHEVVAASGQTARLDVALELERVALQDSSFVDHHLFPNVDFYTGMIYSGVGLPDSMFTGCSPSPARPAGWRKGGCCSTTRIRRSPARARSTTASGCATPCRLNRATENRRPGVHARTKGKSSAWPVQQPAMRCFRFFFAAPVL